MQLLNHNLITYFQNKPKQKRRNIMNRQFLKKLFVGITICCLMTVVMGSLAKADSNDDSDIDRNASWHETQYGTDAFGGTWMLGQFGPDVGYGEQGMIYEYSDPMNGTYVSYQSTDMGMGFGGPLMGYGGMFSPIAEASYGPYAGGNRPQVQATPAWDTQGYVSGDLWGNNTNAFQAQYNPMAGFMFNLAGMFGTGFGGYGGLFGGAPVNYSAYSGYGYGTGAGYGNIIGGYGGGYGYGYPNVIY
jgi:hypothetical protein